MVPSHSSTGAVLFLCAMAAGAIAMESGETINPDMSARSLKARAEQL